jgi:DMSO reductase anchor subunit
MGGLGGLTALLTIISTGMIYYVVRAVAAWNTPWVLFSFIILGLLSGLLVALNVSWYTRPDLLEVLRIPTILFLVMVLIIKGYYYKHFWVTASPQEGLPHAVGIKTAMGRVMDICSSSPNYLTHEFGYTFPYRVAVLLKGLVLLLVFVSPLGVLLLLSDGGLGLAVALLSCLVGTGIERWLFFSEAYHAQNLYQGI